MIKEKRQDAILTQIQPPGPEQVTAVGATLQAVVTERGMTEEDLGIRQRIVTTMQDFLLSVLPEVKLRLYGSSCTKLGFNDSDINIDVQFPLHMKQPEVLLLVRDSLSACSLYVDLEADFHARVPAVICTEKKSGLVCKVSVGNDSACLTTSYFSALARREPVLLPLILSFRLWARICHMDQAEDGGLPSYVFSLMVIYFLQQRKEAMLPTYLDHKNKELSASKLSDFSLTHIEDGYVFWKSCTTSKESFQPAQDSNKTGKSPLVFQSSCPSAEVGHLWVEMLRFYSLEFNMAEEVISVRTHNVVSREAKDWPKKRIAVEDPFAVRRNVARTLNSQKMYEYFMHCLKTTYKYFALPLNPPNPNLLAEPNAVTNRTTPPSQRSARGLEPQTAMRPAEESLQQDSDCIEEEVEEESEKEEPFMNSLSEDEEDDDQDKDGEEDDQDENVDRRRHVNSLTEEEMFPLDDKVVFDKEGLALETPSSAEDEEELACTPPPGPSVEDSQQLHRNKKKDLRQAYRFSRALFTRGKVNMKLLLAVAYFNPAIPSQSHIVVCSLCKRDGHLKKDCPEDFKKVVLNPLPPMTPKFLQTLNQVCEQCYKDFAPDDLEIGVREHILKDLESFIRPHFAGAKLQLFGSSKNGFGFKQSDLDICMVLEGQETPDDLDCISIIESLARLLRKHSGLKNILPITTAKVPIVKFYHVRTGLEGDISLYNTLALHNTNLLASYAASDRRVRILCYVMKVFAKMCDIGDASRGSLSSYAYTLMVIFYLQQRQPPVLPVLQEINPRDKKTEVLVDGWNVYFFDDLEALPSRWPQYQKNTEAVGQLWLGLLRFYTEEFDFREHVISTRQQAPLTTFHKQWTSKYIVIEDPFDLNHNLGAGLTRRMTNFIMKAFVNGRRTFGTPFKSLTPEYSSPMEYFFDPEVLTEGQLAPNDRCCRICGKIGHFMKDCPMRKKSKQRRDQERADWADNRRQESRFESVDGTREQNLHRGGDYRTKPEEKRCCFICGSPTHLKKDCPQYRGSLKAEQSSSFSTSPSCLRNFLESERQGLSAYEDKKKKKHQNVILNP
ncbi:terminal uridylyltransferase 7 [Aplochiton taeniatus]